MHGTVRDILVGGSIVSLTVEILHLLQGALALSDVSHSILVFLFFLQTFSPFTPTLSVPPMCCKQGCLVIFFTNYLALMIKAELASPDSNSATVYAVGLVIVNVCFFLSIWWNALATVRATFSGSHVQVCAIKF